MDQSAQARFLSQIEDVRARPTVAKVIINARTGSVVMNRTVMIEEAAVAGNLSVIINRQNQVSQPDTPFTQGQTVVVPNTQIEVRQENGSLQRVNTSANRPTWSGPERAGRHAAGPAGHPAGHEVRRRAARRTRVFNGKAHPEALRASPRGARRTGKAGSRDPVSMA